MRSKNELHSKEQDIIIAQIITILDLEHNNAYTLIELDNNTILQKQIMELIPQINKWFSLDNMKSVEEFERIKRPWLFIIKQLIQNKYEIESKEYYFKKDNQWLMTKQYFFTKI